jgi:hypothetical protein
MLALVRFNHRRSVMSQVTHSPIPLRTQLRSHWIVAVSALLALLATAAVVLVLVLDNESRDTGGSVAQSSHSALRSDGGPDESSVAASVGSAPKAEVPESSAYVSESRIAASLSTATEPQPRPDESRIAASIAGR